MLLISSSSKETVVLIWGNWYKQSGKGGKRKSLPSGFGPDFSDRSSVALRPGQSISSFYFVEWNSFNRYYTILDGRPGKSKLLLTGLSNWTRSGKAKKKRTRVNVFSLLPILLCFPHSLISTLFNAFQHYFSSFSFLRIDLGCWPFGSKVVSKIFAHSRVCRCAQSVVPTSEWNVRFWSN